MNCTDVSAILDTHHHSRLSAAERCSVDEHMGACEDCAAAWHAHTQLLGLQVPPVPLNTCPGNEYGPGALLKTGAFQVGPNVGKDLLGSQFDGQGGFFR